jgi:hypothetical protein
MCSWSWAFNDRSNPGAHWLAPQIERYSDGLLTGVYRGWNLTSSGRVRENSSMHKFSLARKSFSFIGT